MGAKKKQENLPPTTDKEKTSKTPQPNIKTAVPTHKEKEKEIDPSDSFKLWIPEPLETIEVQIHSKKRILEILQEKTENIDAELKRSILVRDQQINSLNKVILGLKSEIKQKDEHIKLNDHSSHLSVLHRELAEMRKNQESYDENMQRMREEFESAQVNWYDEKDSFMLQQEAVVEDQQALVSKLSAKDTEIRAVTEDIAQMIKVGNDINHINNQLQKKVEALNEEIENCRKRLYEALARADIAEEIEAKYIELAEDRNNMHRQLQELVSSRELHKDIFHRDFKVEISRLASMLTEYQSSAEPNEESNKGLDASFYKLMDQIELIQAILKDTNSEACKSIEKVHDQFIRVTVGDTSNEIKIKLLEARERNFQTQLNEHFSSAEKTQKDLGIAIANLSKLVENLRDQNKGLLENNHELLEEISKKEAELQKCKTKFIHQSTRIEGMVSKNKEITQKESEYKSMITSLQMKINGVSEERKSTNNQLNIREKRIKAVLTQIQILREEIFNKDSELLKKSRETLKLEALLDEVKSQMQKINSKMKMTDAEVLKNINSEIESKDKQIAMLKEMLRANNQELKAKENFISHYKRKSENIANSSREL